MKISAILISVLIVSGRVMASDEIIVSASAKIASGSLSQQQTSGDVKLDMNATSPAYNGALLVLPDTGWTALPVGSVASNGFLWVKNVDTNAWITDGGATTNAGGRWALMGVTNTGAGIVSFGKLFAGEIGLVPLDPGASIYFQPCTSSVPLQIFLLTR